MNDVKQNFNKSIKYTYHLHDVNPSFVYSVYFLISRLNNNKNIRITHKGKNGQPFSNYITILKSQESLRNKNIKDGKDYSYYNLTRNIAIPLYRDLSKNPKKSWLRHFGISLYFKNKYTCKEFLKEVGIRKEDVIFGAYLAKFKAYEVVLRFEDGVTKESFDWFSKKFNLLKSTNLRYKNVGIHDFCYIPGTIYDRWFDPFTGKTQWNSKVIVKSFRNVIKNSDLAKKLINSTKKYEVYGEKYANSRVNYFISNNNRLSTEMIRSNLYIVNRYLQEKNPYKINSCRKDWKYAAEMYLNEVIGKVLYRRAKYIEESSKDVNKDNYGDDINEICKALDFRTDQRIINKFHEVFFSKREAELFIKSLNLSTKINVLKLRKVVLDFLTEHNILETDNNYKRKVTCRSFSFNRDIANKFYLEILEILNSFSNLFFSFSDKKKIIYMLENKSDQINETKGLTNNFSTNTDKISGPPDSLLLNY